MSYEAPVITELGSLEALTLQNFNKNAGASDTVTISGQVISIPGSGSV